jgi:hypothetical protein
MISHIFSSVIHRYDVNRLIIRMLNRGRHRESALAGSHPEIARRTNGNN